MANSSLKLLLAELCKPFNFGVAAALQTIVSFGRVWRVSMLRTFSTSRHITAIIFA